jgi:hypothetical protein
LLGLNSTAQHNTHTYYLMQDFKSDSENIRYTILIATIAGSIAALWIWGPEVIFGLIFFYYFLGYARPWDFSIEKIEIRDELFIVVKRNLFLGTKELSCDLRKVDFNYRTRPITSSRGSFDSYSNRGDVLMLFYEEHLMFDLTPGEGNWSNSAIKNVVRELKSHGVKQVLEKFGSDDVII